MVARMVARAAAEVHRGIACGRASRATRPQAQSDCNPPPPLRYAARVSSTIRRPLWRSFTERFIANAAEHVRAGGHALVWRKGPAKPVGWIVVPCGPDGEVTELGYWSMLALDKRTYDVIPRGPAKGLATLRVPRDLEWAVEEWCERDAKWRGAMRELELDCVACSACCRRNRVELDADDFQRWHDAGRDDLRGRAYTRTDKGKVVLRLKKDGGCVHLNGTLCGIYSVRPDNCSMFPAGSEPCLGSREEEFGLVD
jgi:Fe-S-cluster containining protein